MKVKYVSHTSLVSQESSEKERKREKGIFFKQLQNLILSKFLFTTSRPTRGNLFSPSDHLTDHGRKKKKHKLTV